MLLSIFLMFPKVNQNMITFQLIPNPFHFLGQSILSLVGSTVVTQACIAVLLAPLALNTHIKRTPIEQVISNSRDSPSEKS